MSNRRSVVWMIVFLAIGGIVAVLFPRVRRQYERHRMKLTVTRMGIIGQACLAAKPKTTDCVEILRLAGVRLGAETCLDGWKNRIAVQVRRDFDGSAHYIVLSDGPTNATQKPAFIWADGEWQRLMPETPP